VSVLLLLGLARHLVIDGLFLTCRMGTAQDPNDISKNVQEEQHTVYRGVRGHLITSSVTRIMQAQDRIGTTVLV
jgi:hypothetical protein